MKFKVNPVLRRQINRSPLPFPRLLSTILLILCVQAPVGSVAHAGEPVALSELSLEELMEVRVKNTMVATKTEIDSDLVPGMVTVLTGKELEVLGVQTLWDALNLVPGVSAANNLSFRSLGAGYASGKVKFFIDGIPFNLDFAGTVGAPYVPVEAIDRIEVIRGPGSAIYGEYALAGVINVITIRDENKAYIKYGSFNTQTAGAIISHSNAEKQFDFSLNIFSLSHGRTGMTVGNDGLYGTPNQGVSQAPNAINDKISNLEGSLRLTFKELYLEAIYGNDQNGSGLGFTTALPPLDDRLNVQMKSTLVEAGWKPQINENMRARLYAGERTGQWSNDRVYLYPPGYSGMSASGPTTYADGMLAGPHLQEEADYVNGELFYNGFSNHELLIGAGHQASVLLNSWQEDNYNPLTGVPVAQVTVFGGNTSWLAPGTKRDINSIFAQDQFHATDRLNITAGVRYDQYSDMNSNVSPRIAGVYDLGDGHFIKAQYSQAFRPPNYMELYFMNNPIYNGNGNLAPETIRTSEMEYVYKGEAKEFKITAFYSDVANLIVVENAAPKPMEMNGAGAITRGLEGEWEASLGHGLKFSGNMSYENSYDLSTGAPIAGATNWLGNAWLIYQPRYNFTVSLLYQYIGYIYRAQGDTRPNIPQFDVLNLTVSHRNFILNGLSISGGVNNIFDERTVMPSSIYLNDITLPGRSFWVGLSYRFDATSPLGGAGKPEAQPKFTSNELASN